MLLGLISLFLAGVVSCIPLVLCLRWRRTWKEKNNQLLFVIGLLAAFMVLVVGALFSLYTVERWYGLQVSEFQFWGILAYMSSFIIGVRLFVDPGYRKLTPESTLVPIGEGKDCWFCKNEIPSHVKSCPYCHTYQSRLTLGFPPIGVALVILMFAAGPFTGWYLGVPAFREGAPFQAHAAQVRVLSSTVEFRGDDYRTFIFVEGRIQNDSDVTWTYAEIEVPFFNKEGTLVDTLLSRGIQSPILMPHAETTFRVYREAVRPKEDYFRHEVIVKDAIDKASVLY